MAAAAVKGLRVDLRGAAGRPWVPKREGPREDEAAAGHELCEFEEAGCRPRGGDAGGGGRGGGRPGRAAGARVEGAAAPPQDAAGAGRPRSAAASAVRWFAPWRSRPPAQVLTQAVLFQVKPVLWLEGRSCSFSLRKRVFEEMIKPYCK